MLQIVYLRNKRVVVGINGGWNVHALISFDLVDPDLALGNTRKSS